MKRWRNFDPQLFCIPAGLVAFSIFVLYAISRWPSSGVTVATPIRQALYAVVGLALLLFLTNFDYRLLRPLATPLFLVALGGLLIVLVLGHAAYGAQRWINLGIIQLQPSEPAKLALIVMLAKHFSDHEQEIERVGVVLRSLLMVAIPAVLVLTQPDLGTSAVFAAIWVGMALMAGVRPAHLAVLAGIAASLLPVAWLVLGRIPRYAYAESRLTIFMDPTKDPLNQGYNVIHALITVGSGGFLGQHFAVGTQSGLGLLRVEDKDFIFSVIAEQIGFVGVLLLFAVLVTLLLRIARVAFMAGDAFGRLLASGILAMLMFQIVVNIGMNIGLMPVTGIPLPLISYGGSSLITTLAAFGILQSVLLRHRKLIFGRA